MKNTAFQEETSVVVNWNAGWTLEALSAFYDFSVESKMFALSQRDTHQPCQPTGMFIFQGRFVFPNSLHTVSNRNGSLE